MKNENSNSWVNSEILIVENKNGKSIQDAIDSAKDWLIVQLLSGEYYINQTLLVSSNIWLRGAEDETSKLVLEPRSDCHILTNQDFDKGNTNIRISNVNFNGMRQNQQRALDDKRLLTCNAMYFKHVNDIEIDNIKADEILHTALHFSSCRHVRIKNFNSAHVGWSGISTSGTSDITIIDAYIYDSGLDKMHSGIHLDGGIGAHIEAHVEKCTGNGIMLDSKFALLSNISADCVASNCKRGIALCGAVEHPLTDAFITGRFYQNREIGILVSNSQHVFIANADVEDNLEYGILLQGSIGSTCCTVTKCRISGSDIPIAEIHQSTNNFFAINSLAENSQQVKLKSTVEKMLETIKPKRVVNSDLNSSKVSTLNSNLEEHNYKGNCNICSEHQTFYKNHKFLREGYRCISCKASLRYRGQAKAILEKFSNLNAQSIKELAKEYQFQELSIYEPGIVGSFRNFFGSFEDYVTSYYWEDIPIGAYHNGIQCQNLEILTYAENRFDLVITSDIMEHVRHPWKAFESIFYTLKPGGYHIFTIPVQHPMPKKTVFRVDTSTEEDVFLLEARYHIAGDGSRSLVYTDFGQDLIGQLEDIGYTVELSHLENQSL